MSRESAENLIADSETLRADLKRTAARLLAFSRELASEVQELRDAGGDGDDEGAGSGAAVAPD